MDETTLQQIYYCLQQLQRFSFMFACKRVDSFFERMLQLAYTYGRLLAIFRKNIDFFKSDPVIYASIDEHMLYDLATAKRIILAGLNLEHYTTENDQYTAILNYGFTIGFCQDCLLEDHHKWWKPISQLAAEQRWDELVAITKDNLISSAGYADIPDSYRDYYVFPFDQTIDWIQFYKQIVDSNYDFLVLMKNKDLALS